MAGSRSGKKSGVSNRGFASMNQDRQREIARMGGSASGGNFKNDPERAAQAGRKGGEARGSKQGRGRASDAG